MIRVLVAINLIVLLALQAMYAYEHWEGLQDMLRWQAAVISNCESNKFKRPSYAKENEWNRKGQPGVPWQTK